MRRRDFLVMAGAAAAFPSLAVAQQLATGTKRLAFLFTLAESDPTTPQYLVKFREGLAGHGWMEGKNLMVDYRWGVSTDDTAAKAVMDVLDLRPDVLLATADRAAIAGSRLTHSVPIIFTLVTQPVADEIVPSRARPAGNVTGFLNGDAPLGGKLFSLLKQLAPNLKRAAILFTPPTQGVSDVYVPAFEAAARTASVEPLRFTVTTAADVMAAMASVASQPDSGVVGGAGSPIAALRPTMLAEAARYRLPAVWGHVLFAADGGLITYGLDAVDQLRQAGDYVGQVLSGTKVADLPVQSPNKFQLIVNLRTAKAVGITVPTSLIAVADQVVE